jgi:Tol biopolymer transport system component
MPDFDTRRPQRPNEPSTVGIRWVANKLRLLLIAIAPHIRLTANRVRSLFIANPVRTLAISGGIVLLMVSVSLGLLIYSPTRIGDQLRASMVEDPTGKKITLGMRRVGKSYRYDFDYDLYVVNTDGSSLTRLTNGAEPAWSPDGKRIAFVRYVDEPNSTASAAASSASPAPFKEVPYISVMNADGSGQQRLVDRPALEPAWSPNGNQIAFSLYQSGDHTFRSMGHEYCGIYVMNADRSGSPRKLATGPGCASSPAWSPDGKKIAYTNELGLAKGGRE